MDPTPERSSSTREHRFWNPYVAGVALGAVLLAAFVASGRGLGASGAAFRIGTAAAHAVAPAQIEAAPGFRHVVRDGSPLDDWLVFEVLGLVLGAFVAAYGSGRLSPSILRGPRLSAIPRLALALAGGVAMGFAAMLARGCTSGQALTGGALLSAGSWAFMLAVFAGGYGAAWFVRRAWR